MKRSEAYPLIEELLMRGFLSASMNICGNMFVFKTLTEKELDLVKLMSGSRGDPEYTCRYNIYFLTYSVFSVDGENVLGNKNRLITDFIPFWSGMNEKLSEAVMDGLSSLRNDMYNTLKYLEGYSYTTKSRYQWRSRKGQYLNSVSLTGIPGSESLGLNTHQENWIAINRMIDTEEVYNKDFNLALLVASAMNPKGVRRIRNQHDMSTRSTEERREKLAREGYIDTNKPVDGWAAPVDTAEELVAELERQIHGRKDRHDLFMEKYMERMKSEAENRRAEAEERIREAREASSELPRISGEQRVLSPEEMQELMRKRGKIKTLVDVAPDHKVTEEDESKFLKKVGNRVITGRR